MIKSFGLDKIEPTTLIPRKRIIEQGDGSLTEKCEICGEYHPIHNDGFDYLDCMGWIKEQQRIKKMRKQNE